MALPNDSLLETFNVDPTLAKDPEGKLAPDARGVAPGYDLTAGALGHPELIYQTKDGRFEVTFFADCFPDHVHLHCPLCRAKGEEHGIMIRQGVKEWLYEPMRSVPVFPGWSDAKMLVTYPKGAGGRLQMRPVKCPWCGESFAIENNVVRPM